MENYFGNFNLFQLCYKWKWHLVIFVLIAGILGLIFSGPFFIKPKFKSVAIVYPANISKFSEESETEQMLQWFESRDIVDSMIKKFDLPQHYKIKTNDKFYMSKIYRTFDENVTIAKTKYESVKIEIYDTDPQIACDMVNSLIDFYNKKVQNIHREKYQEVLTIEESRLMEKKRQQDSLLRTINNIRTKYELIDYGIQTNEVTKGYLGTFDGSNRANVNRTEVKRIKQNIENKGDSLLLITGQLSAVCASYNNFKISYEDALRNVTKVQTFANIVTSPFPADKKSYPSRLLIVFYAMGAALFFSIITIAIIDGRKIFKN
jgi:Uncharacterized protein involved in exopolysaccharide biosynthesis